MKKMVAIIFALLILQGAVFAEGGFAVGASGALYLDEEIGAGDFFTRMQNGDGVFYGGLAEIGMDNLAFGLAANFSYYEYDFIPGIWSVAMMDYDVNLYAQAHLLKYESFFDPFGEVGFGMMATDFANEVDDPDPENALLQTPFFHAGGGLNINIGKLGVFFKGLYMFRINDPSINTAEYFLEDGVTKVTYQLDLYPLKNLKLLLGVKLIL